MNDEINESKLSDNIDVLFEVYLRSRFTEEHIEEIRGGDFYTCLKMFYARGFGDGVNCISESVRETMNRSKMAKKA